MNKFQEIRPIVLGIVIKNNKILVSKGINENRKFYRCLGGGIEFLEKGEDALKREFKEEIGIDIIVKKYLGLAENIFTYNGKDAHEIVLFYEMDIRDEDYKEEYVVDENGEKSKAIWVDISEFKNGNEIIYPVEMLNYI